VSFAFFAPFVFLSAKTKAASPPSGTKLLIRGTTLVEPRRRAWSFPGEPCGSPRCAR